MSIPQQLHERELRVRTTPLVDLRRDQSVGNLPFSSSVIKVGTEYTSPEPWQVVVGSQPVIHNMGVKLKRAERNRLVYCSTIRSKTQEYECVPWSAGVTTVCYNVVHRRGRRHPEGILELLRAIRVPPRANQERDGYARQSGEANDPKSFQHGQPRAIILSYPPPQPRGTYAVPRG